MRFVLFFLVFSFFHLDASDLNQNIAITVVDQQCLLKTKIVDDLLSLQHALVIPLHQPIPEDKATSGCLLIEATKEYIEGVLREKQALIVAAYLQEALVGYALVVDISAFKELYEDRKAGFIESPEDLENLENLFASSNIRYIEQIAVKSGLSRMGVGSLIMKTIKDFHFDGLIADVFLDPLFNEPSCCFFRRHGFMAMAILSQFPRSDFPYSHRTQVFLWLNKFL